MSNFNDTPKTTYELRRIATDLTTDQRRAKAALDFLDSRNRRVGQSRVAKQELEFAADYHRDELPNGRYPWESRATGHDDEPVPELPKWLKRELNPPWWLRLARRLDPRHQLPDWDRDIRTCIHCDEPYHPYLHWKCPTCGHFPQGV